MSFFKINREERHFGFLFMAAILSNSRFRERVFKAINERHGIALDPNNFDIYAEVAIFRDHWRSLGNQTKYDDALHVKRLEMLKNILSAMCIKMDIEKELVDEFDMFWTKDKGSKLRYPGKWQKNKIKEIEEQKPISDNKLLRCRWLFNAKPDLMIQSPNNILFIEIKVESGMGPNQEKIQKDIILVGPKVIGSMRDANVKRINLTKNSGSQGLSWGEVKAYLEESRKESRIENDRGFEMISRHFEKMPK